MSLFLLLSRPVLPAPSPTPVPSIASGAIRVELELIASGLHAPNDLTSVGDGRLFVDEQTGTIRILKAGALLPTPFLDLSARLIGTGDERGLLGFTFHPGYNDPKSPGYGRFYTFTTEPISGPADFTVPISGPFSHQNVVAEWQRSIDNPDLAEAASRREVLRVDQPQYSHNGGQLAFCPNEPYLYISLGDGGCCNDTADGHNPEIGNGQDLATVLGKILRVDPLDPGLTNGSSDPVSVNGHYRVPLSNPFIEKSDALPEIYAYGFRNPFRFSFDESTGRLIVGDVGQSQIEEVDLVEAGKNYGWNRKEGSFLFNPDDGSIVPDPSPDPALVDPVVQYTHQDGISVIGGYVYHGTSVPALNDMYVFGDYAYGSSGRLLYSDFQGGLIHEFYLAGTVDSFDKFIKGFGRDDEGELYVLGDDSADGVVYKIAPIAATSALLNLSTRLKVDTGDNVLTGGFIIAGSASEQVVLRGLGPSLVPHGVNALDTLSDPMIELHDGSGALIAANDDWTEGAQAGEIAALGLAPNDGFESALLAQLPPGSYTTILKGTDAGSGIGLIEIYATSISAPVNPVNISTRGLVQAGDDVMIGGFILGGTTPRQLALRAIGPSLGSAGVSNPLPDPILELHNQDGELIAFNDNWQDTQQTEIEAAGLAPTAKLESAIVATLSPAPYTVVLRGKNNAVGVALVEAYQLDD